MLNSQRLPRNEVVWRRRVTRSSSSGAGLPVRRKAGRTLAAIPKSVIQTSPGFTLGIFVLHAIKHHGTLQSRLVAGRNVLILIGDIQKDLPDRPALYFRELRDFFNNFCCAHSCPLPA